MPDVNMAEVPFLTTFCSKYLINALTLKNRITRRLREGIVNIMIPIDSMRMTFIESAVRVVARCGLENTTTKAIAADAGLNEAYIYRCFENKENLLSEAFHMEDVGYANLLRKTRPVMNMKELSWKERCFLLWRASWLFILQKDDECIFYLRYYYSASCRKYAYKTHMECFTKLIDESRHAFKPGVNVDLLVHQIFDTMLAFALRVLSGEMENNDAAVRWTFEQIYCFVAPNIKEELLQEEGNLSDNEQNP